MRGPLRIGKLVGSGGEGAVYEDRNDPHMVIKVLHQQHATPERAAKLHAMRNNPPQNAEALSWPNAVEYDANGLRYQMPKASKAAGTAYRFISANERRQLPRHQQGYEYRAKLGVRIAEAFRGLHAGHVRIGDVNPSNILVRADGSVMLIDCDSFQIPDPPGHQPYPCVVGSPEYTAPEIDDFRQQFRSQDSDNFALAVLLYQLLGNGSHPYQGIDTSANDAVSNIWERIKGHRFAHHTRDNRWRPTPGQLRSWRAMPEPVRSAFRQAFSPMATRIGRPTADTWASILEENPNPALPESSTTTSARVSSGGKPPPKSQTPRSSRPTRVTGSSETGTLRHLVPVLILIAGIGVGAFYWHVSHDTQAGTAFPQGEVLPDLAPQAPTPTVVPTATPVQGTATPTPTSAPSNGLSIVPLPPPTPTLIPTWTPTPDWPPQPHTEEWSQWMKGWSSQEVDAALEESVRDFDLTLDSLEDLPLSEACPLADELGMRLTVASDVVEVHRREDALVPGQHAGLTWKIWLRNKGEVLAETVASHVPPAECRSLLATASVNMYVDDS